MIIGIPKEIKDNENRTAIVPVVVEELVKRGHEVLIEKGAGLGSSISDEDYISSGAELVDDVSDIFAGSDMVIKVKEPLPREYEMIKEGQILFTYFHFAASKELTLGMMERKAVCIAYETIEDELGRLPLLIPMSEVAGRMAIQEGAKYLEKPMEGRGILLGGVPGVAPANVVILGGGVVGTNAAKMAAGLGARVTILDVNMDRLRYLDDIMPKNVVTLMSNSYNIKEKLKEADLLIGAVLISGAKAPILVSKDMLRLMKPGSVIIDVAVDQGGCIETCHPTTHSNPTFIVEGILHYCVANMPGAVAGTSTYALTNVTLPYAVQIAEKGWKESVTENKGLSKGLNVVAGKITYQAIAEGFGLEYTPLENVL